MADRLFIVRHGETEWSRSGQHTSHTDLPLTKHGIEQGEVVGRKLSGESFELVLCSPLSRARETCRLAGFADAAEIDDDLREWDYGEYEGRTTPQIRQQNPDWWLWRDGCPGGESPEEVGARLGPGGGALRRGRRRRAGVRARPFAAGADRSLARARGGDRRAFQARGGGGQRARPRARDADDRPLERLTARR